MFNDSQSPTSVRKSFILIEQYFCLKLREIWIRALRYLVVRVKVFSVTFQEPQDETKTVGQVLIGFLFALCEMQNLKVTD